MEQLEKTSMPLYKRCCHCKTTKPISGFWKDKSRVDGLENKCKICDTTRCTEYYMRNRNKKIKRQAEYDKSDRGKLVYSLYVASGRCAQSQRERYYRIQDSFGRHNGIRDWHPGYRIIRALETAEVVEIKP